MHLFIRSVTVKHAASAAAALQFAGEVCTYVNKTYQVNMRCGMEVFGRLRIHCFHCHTHRVVQQSLRQRLHLARIRG